MAITDIGNLKKVVIKQKKELAELLGYETRNKYSIETPEGAQVAFAAEQQKGVFGFFLRQFLGHWRSFEFRLFDADRKVILHAKHPFRVFFQRLEISTPEGQVLGAAQRRFSILTKSFDVINPAGEVLYSVRSPIWRLWTFPFMREGAEHCVVRKKWGGVLKEAFTDADTFELEFTNLAMSEAERVLAVTAALYIDLMFFENKAN